MPRLTPPAGARAWLAMAALSGVLCGCDPPSAHGQIAPLTLERAIVLKDVAGRIDHLAIDGAHDRLFVAELGNGSVEAVDLKSGAVLGRISGLKEPQGLAYLPALDQLAVAGGGDGAVRFFRAADLAPLGSALLGDDADNLRLDPKSGQVLVGYGSGGLAIIDPGARKIVGRIALPAHPESFQLDPAGPLVYVNLPGAHQIAVVDREVGKSVTSIGTGTAFANFPMTLDPKARRLAVVFRAPSELRVYALADRSLVATLRTCGDADDIFLDAPRNRFYVICGEGVVDVIQARGAGYASVGRFATAPGARTGLWSAMRDRLYVAAPARGGAGARLVVFKPAP
jgi:DNA-binding beta-propeller fold protein YncE